MSRMSELAMLNEQNKSDGSLAWAAWAGVIKLRRTLPNLDARKSRRDGPHDRENIRYLGRAYVGLCLEKRDDVRFPRSRLDVDVLDQSDRRRRRYAVDVEFAARATWLGFSVLHIRQSRMAIRKRSTLI